MTESLFDTILRSWVLLLFRLKAATQRYKVLSKFKIWLGLNYNSKQNKATLRVSPVHENVLIWLWGQNQGLRKSLLFLRGTYHSASMPYSFSVDMGTIKSVLLHSLLGHQAIYTTARVIWSPDILGMNLKMQNSKLWSEQGPHFWRTVVTSLVTAVQFHRTTKYMRSAHNMFLQFLLHENKTFLHFGGSIQWSLTCFPGLIYSYRSIRSCASHTCEKRPSNPLILWNLPSADNSQRMQRSPHWQHYFHTQVFS